jgi:hypothetical protein
VSLVYSESAVKKKPFFSSGEPEPQLREGELFIYLNNAEEYFVVGHEKTPVSNAFINKNKINYRIRMAAGPFTYEHSDEYFTFDHRKYLRVIINLRLEIADAVKLYNAKVSNINSYLDGIIPSFIASVVENYEVNEIITLQQKLRDVDMFPGLTRDLKTIGLRVTMYNARVQKDDLQRVLDGDYRQTEHDIGMEKLVETQRRKTKYEMDTIDAVSKAKSIIAILNGYDRLLVEEGVSPELLLETADEEHKELLRSHWEKTGTLLEKPKNSSLDSRLDLMLDEINIDKL